MRRQGLGGTGATLAARLLDQVLVNQWITNEIEEGKAVSWSIPPNTGPDLPFTKSLQSIGPANFPYGFRVPPDEPR